MLLDKLICKQSVTLNLEVFMQLESDNSCRSEATFDEEDEGMLSAEDVFLA